MFIAVGFYKTNRLRAERYLEAKKRGYTLPAIINSKACTYPGLVIGDNSNIGPFTFIQPGVKIGNNVLIRGNVFIGHDAVVGDHCFLAAGSAVGGGSYVSEYCFLGMNSTIRESVHLAKSCVIGAGVTMLKNTKEKEVFISNKVIKYPFSSDDL